MSRAQKRKLLRPRAASKSPSPVSTDNPRSSPYMFYHGEPHEKDPKEVRDASPFHKSDLPLAMEKADELFTGGLCQRALDELRKRQDRHRCVLKDDVFTHQKSANLAAVQRRFAESIALTMPVKIVPSERKGSLIKLKGSHKPSEPVPKSDPNASGSFDDIAASPLDTGPQLSVAKIIEVLKNDFDISNPNLFEALTAALPNPTLPFFNWMNQLDAILNNPTYSMNTRLACFRVFDVDEVRVVTSKSIRAMRCAKPQQLAERTNGGNFHMVKTMLDLFCHPDSEWTSTITQEDFMPLLDVDENLVQGYMEEIVRQLLVQKYEYNRNDLLSIKPAQA